MKSLPRRSWGPPRVALQLTLCLLLQPGVARAHAVLDHADPKVGATVAAPRQVRIWFDGELEPAFSSITLRGPSGAVSCDGPARVNRADPRLLELDVPQLVPGTYRVAWSAATRDGHRTAGEYTFTVR